LPEKRRINGQFLPAGGGGLVVDGDQGEAAIGQDGTAALEARGGGWRVEMRANRRPNRAMAGGVFGGDAQGQQRWGKLSERE
jgi:hypothetical protein